MKNILVIGNGFDLHHYLPTRYKDFVDVIKRLITLEEEGKIDVCDYLAYIYGPDSPVNKNSEYIAKCYEVHQAGINRIELDHQVQKQMLELAKTNIWINYFFQRDKKDVGWIDFEKEIAQVLSAFSEAMDTLDEWCQRKGEIYKTYELSISNTRFETLYILDKFQDVFENSGGDLYLKEIFWEKEQFGEMLEYVGVNEEKIVDFLYSQLEDLKRLLVLYIKEFVQKIAVYTQSQCKLFRENFDSVISFNYTNTFSTLYSEAPVYYIHGSAEKNNIVLGINDDETDQLLDMNLRFVKFKKYYQRVVNNTFVDYETLIGSEEDCVLHFVGHSLDKTDRDILKELIEAENVKKSIIYYHNSSAYSQLTINLISLFGKDEFDDLMQKNKIEFQQLDDFE